jgi:hypothetical protein
MLAIELGAREAARRLGIKQSTVLSWARRYDWKLPKRKGGGTNAITLHAKPGDALIATHKELEDATKTGLMQTLAKAVKALAKKDALSVENIAQFKDACLAAAKLFGWDGKEKTEVSIHNQVGVGIVCDEATRKRLIELREQIGAPVPQNALEPHKEKVQASTPPPMLPASTSRPAPQTQLQANCDTGDAIATPRQTPAAEKDPVLAEMESIGKAESWKHGKGV